MIVKNENRICRFVVPAMLVAIGVCYALLTWFYTYTGDDLMYRLSWEEHYKNIIGYPLFAFRHWFHINGRIADKINPFTLSMMPRWMYAVVNGIIIALMYFAIVKNAKCRSVVGSIVCVSIVGLFLTWWDGMMIYVCHLNYLWSTAFGLLAIYMILSATEIESRLKLWLCGLFAIIAGGMHEASGMPLACGLVAWLYLSNGYRNLTQDQKSMLKCFFVGALFSVSSPGSYERLIFGKGDGLSATIVIPCSVYLTLLMIAWIAIGLMIRSMRENMLRLARTPWVIFVVASIVSLAFCAVSGIIGRTGWFSQLFAVIAVFYYYNAVGLRVRRSYAAVVASVVLMVLAVHYAELLRQQYVMGSELKMAIAEYQKSTDGVVYLDYTRDSQQRPWALRKARGIPDPSATEMYYINSITKYYGEGRPFMVLPKTLERVDAREISGIMNLGNEYYVTDRVLASGWDTLRADASDVALYFPRWGRRDGYAVVPFYKDSRRLYLLSPREIDPDSPEFYAKIIGR